MANYVTYSPDTFNVRFDGSTLTGSFNLKQLCKNAGFENEPALLSFTAFGNSGNFIPGATASISGYVLSYSLPSGTTAFGSFALLLGF